MNTIVAKVISFPLIPSWKLRRKLTLKMTRIDNYARTLSTFNKQRRAQNDSKRKTCVLKDSVVLFLCSQEEKRDRSLVCSLYISIMLVKLLVSR